jgi:hypothetical protein
MYTPFRRTPKDIKCENCSYVVVEPYPENCLCRNCKKFSANIYDAVRSSETHQQTPEPHELEISTRTPSSEVEGVSVRALQNNGELTEEYYKFLGIISMENSKIYSSEENYDYLLELTY